MGSGVFWAALCGFLIGVFARSFLPLSFAYAALLILFAFAAIGLSLFERRRSRQGIIAAAALCACALGIVRMQSATLTGDPALSAHLGQYVSLEGYVFAEPDERDAETLLSVRAASLSLDGTSTPVGAGVLVFAPEHADIAYGDTVRASGILRVPQAFDTGAGQQFNYPEYLGVQGIEYELDDAQVSELSHGGNVPMRAALAIKALFVTGLGEALPEPQAGLAAGITVGDKRSIGPELSADFDAVSLTQIIVLSGYNITVLINALAWLVRRTPLLRDIRHLPLGSAAVAAVFFVLISGGAASATRAGIMALIAAYARVSGRTFSASRALVFAIAAIVAWNPLSLTFDPGLQLSALATVGLIVLSPFIAARVGWITERFALREIVATTAGAQLAVLPLLLYESGSLGVYAVPANIAAMIVMPAAMLCSFVAGVAGLALGPAAAVVALPAYALLSYIIDVARFFASLPLSQLPVGNFGGAWVALSYALIFGVSAVLNKRKERPDTRPAAQAFSFAND